jgi:hypothetical protein
MKHTKASVLAVFALLLPFLIYRFVHFPSRRTRSAEVTLSSPTVSALASLSNHSSDADFVRHVEQLKKKLPSNEFSIIVERPFVIIGDEPPQAVKEHAENTIKWAVEKLKQDFFAKDPNEILDIWLFRDAASYEKNTLLLFGEKPGTPYGYYSSAQHRNRGRYTGP